MKNKIQILIVHGGMTFKNKKDYLHFLRTKEIKMEKKISWAWGDGYLEKELGKNFQIIRPHMPLSENAKYDEWKIFFERYLSLLTGKVILIGVSLGGIFLAKYLSENKLTKKILSTYLICPPYDNTLDIEDLVGGFKLKSNLSLIEKNSKNLYLIFSKDDPIVPVSHAKKYKKKLKNAKILIYKSKNGHFKIPKFPEIIKMIKNDVKKIK
jgi:uncharacterized protein